MKLVLYFVILSFCYFFPQNIFATDIRIDGDRIIVKSDDGTVIDTDHLPKSDNINEDQDVEINKNGISIGTVTNNGGEQKNITRRTTMENVTIISNGNKTVYHKKDSSSGNISQEQ